MSRGKIHTTQHVRTNNRIAYEVVNFHEGAPVGVFNQKSKFLSNCKVKLLPAENGDIEVLDMFWRQEDKDWTKPIVPPLLIYADLMGSRIGRNLETAKLIRENELSPLLK